MKHKFQSLRILMCFAFVIIINLKSEAKAYQGFYEPEIADLDWSPDGTRIVIGGGTNNCDSDPVDPEITFLQILDAITLEVLEDLNGANCQITSVDWSPDGTMIVATDLRNLHMWDANTGELLPELTIEGYAIVTARWSPDSSYIAYHDLRGAIQIEHIQGMDTGYSGIVPIGGSEIVWSPDGTRIATSLVSDNDNLIHIFDLQSKMEIQTIESTGIVSDLDWNPDGTQLIGVVSDASTQIWDIESREMLVRIEPNGFPQDIAWDTTGENFATISRDGVVRIWNGTTGQQLTEIQTANFLTTLKWSPNGTQLVAGGDPNSPLNLLSLPSASAGGNQSVNDLDTTNQVDIILDGSASTDSDGTIVSYVWTENGVEIATGATPTVELAVGTHTITLTVTDNYGLTGSDTVEIVVNSG
ncbi:MAG: PKD domain-containing protein [Aggregatilineales bacterium]